MRLTKRQKELLAELAKPTPSAEIYYFNKRTFTSLTAHGLLELSDCLNNYLISPSGREFFKKMMRKSHLQHLKQNAMSEYDFVRIKNDEVHAAMGVCLGERKKWVLYGF